MMRWDQRPGVALACALLVAACGGDDEDELSRDDLVGTWAYVNGFLVTFRDDGTVSGAPTNAQLDTDATVDGVWSLDGSELTWTIEASTIDDCVGASAVYQLEPVDGDVTTVEGTLVGEDACTNRTDGFADGPLTRQS